MKKDLWIVIIIVGGFMGFMLGYSLPPMIETGMIGSEKEQVGVQTEMDQDMKKHYEDLLKESE
jgi:hypothetical protein